MRHPQLVPRLGFGAGVTLIGIGVWVIGMGAGTRDLLLVSTGGIAAAVGIAVLISAARQIGATR